MKRIKEQWIEFSEVFGTDKVPMRTAFILNEAIKTAIRNEDITDRNKWQLLEYLAADYLSGN